MPKILLIATLAAFLSACATMQPGANPGEQILMGMRPVVSSTRIELRSDARYTEKRGLFGGASWTEGVCAGTYLPELEDDEGVYFRAPRRCVKQILGRDPMGGPFEGGIWMPKSEESRPRFYYYFGHDPAAARMAGGVLLTAILASGKGKITFMPPINDDEVVAQIRGSVVDS